MLFLIDGSQRNLNSLPLFTGTISFGPVYSIPDFILPILSDGRESSDMHIYGWHLEFQLLKHFHLLSSTTRRKIPAGSKGAAMRGGFIRPCVFILLVLGHTWTFSKDPNERMSTVSNKTCDKLFKMFACATEYCCLSWNNIRTCTFQRQVNRRLKMPGNALYFSFSVNQKMDKAHIHQ